MVAAFQLADSSRRSGRGCRDRGHLAGAAGRPRGRNWQRASKTMSSLDCCGRRRDFWSFSMGRPSRSRSSALSAASLVLRLSVHAQMRERASADERNFLLAAQRAAGQEALRNLLIWQNHVLPSYFQNDDGRPSRYRAGPHRCGTERETRLFDLFSIVAHAGARSQLRGVPGRGNRHWPRPQFFCPSGNCVAGVPPGEADDLGNMPRALTASGRTQGTGGGIKLLTHGRKYANDLLKLTLPGGTYGGCIAGTKDGDVEPENLSSGWA